MGRTVSQKRVLYGLNSYSVSNSVHFLLLKVTLCVRYSDVEG